MIVKNSCLFKLIAMIFVLPIFTVYFAVNETLDFKTRAKTINVIVVDRRSFLMSKDRSKRNSDEGDDNDISKAPAIIKEHPKDINVSVGQVKCPTNILIDNGYLKLNENGASVSYQCTDGYRLVGSASATCKEDGTWSSPPPKCAVQCHIYIPFNNGIARVNKDKSFVTFQCVSGFRLVGSSSATCREDGTWSSPPPTCTKWRACHWSKIPKKVTDIAEHVAADPFELRYAARNCDYRFKLYLPYLSASTLNNLCKIFHVSNLTSPSLQSSFMHCSGLKIYKFHSDSNANIRVPKQFHNCKKMSFRDPGIPTLLVSFPGSGNSWVRQLLEAATGIYTGSDRDCDVDYIEAGMLGEGIVSDSVIAVKFHLGPLPENWTFKKIIYLIRNPYDTFVAEYKRHCGEGTEPSVKLEGSPHLSQLSDEKFGENEDWKSFVNESAISWRLHVEQWLGSTLPYNSTILVIKFEDLLTNLRTELIRIMKYLEYPYTDKDLDCTMKSNTNSFHRSHDHSDAEHYVPSDVDFVYEQIKMVDKLLQSYHVSYEKL